MFSKSSIITEMIEKATESRQTVGIPRDPVITKYKF
jgi:hypothetical protein